MDVPRRAFYEKELQLRISRSYGPGRYDPRYEEEGLDYPIGYVRWTERRNLACFLDLLARGSVDVEPLVSHIADFDDAVETYQRLKDGDLKAVAVLFRYPGRPDRAAEAEAPAVAVPAVRRGGGASTPARSAKAPVRLAFVGAGNYATSMLLPHLAQRDGVTLSTVVTTTALSAANAQRKFGFAEATTDLDAVLGDKSIDAVFVVTRHSSHAEMTRKALLAGKTVFVEKPLALTEDELAGVLAAVEESGNDRLQVGFNRRFAPLLQEARKRFGARTGPASLRYLVNAGRLQHGSWYLQQGTEGSRFAGEGGHFIDTASWLLEADPISVYATAAPGNEDLQVVLRYPDGSTATISYVTTGAPGFPKETLDLVADGKVLRLDDFVRASVYGRRKWVSSRLPKARDKGQNAELAAFIKAVRTGGPMPVPLESLVATTAATLAVQAGLVGGAPVTLARAR
jgi:predicted dehydrogenase